LAIQKKKVIDERKKFSVSAGKIIFQARKMPRKIPLRKKSAKKLSEKL
jgi:hypothetical protein